jgi:Lar family restriction alleviation protein
MSENLKPCPTCGGMAVVQSSFKQAIHMDFYVRCTRCGLRTEFSTIEEIPVSEWNNRMQEDILRERAERAEADADALSKALKMCLPYAKEDYHDDDTGECPYCGGDGDGDHSSDCKQVAAYMAAKRAIAGHNDALAMKGGE